MIREEDPLHPRCGGSSGALGCGFYAVVVIDAELNRETTVRFPSTAIGNELKSFDARTDIEIVIMFDSQT
ncbi:hypothetical protein L195_g047713 [Trifolium pratense]|uniref:Uncharacterized protein n=1 Tax=Trifolium pratense TaxID=57577 RepID=A0A2K3MLC0_TRIPR|nr:hypothetical protein L195_g047713 [Trifolium pratense]